MKANWADSCSSDDHCSQWEFSKYETAMKYNQGPVLCLPLNLLIKVLWQVNVVNYVPECTLIWVNRKERNQFRAEMTEKMQESS